MIKFRFRTFLSVVVTIGASGCADATSPLAHTQQIPVVMHKLVGGPPDETVNIDAAPGASAALHSFPYWTWVTLEASGTVSFTSLPPTPNASAYYQYPGRALTANGMYDGRVDTNPKCALQLYTYNPAYTATYFSDSGACGGNVKVDTAEIIGAWSVKRGVAPFQYGYDCDRNGLATCHSIDPGGQSVRLRPVPVTLQPLKATKGTLDPSHPASIQFTNWFTPDSITVNGSKTAHPWRTTLWQWIGVDSTRDPIISPRAGCAASAPSGPTSLVCNYAPLESGRMLTKVFVGGWEQTSTITVQCLVTPGDSILNDTTDNFALRKALFDALAKSNADSAAGIGATAAHRGFRHEEGGRIFQWTHGVNSGKYFFVPVDDPNATECHVDVRLGEEENPILGATVVGHYHIHVATPPDSLYGCLPSPDGKKYSQYPGDGLRPYYAPASDTPSDNYGFGGGSVNDWVLALYPAPGHAEYVMWKDGTVYRLSRRVDPSSNTDHWSAFGAARDATKPAGKCTWPKTFSPS